MALCIATPPIVSASTVMATSANVEEKRIKAAEKAIPDVIKTLDDISQYFANTWPKVKTYQDAITLVDYYGGLLWQQAKAAIKKKNNYDDRSIYWQRLKLSKIIRTLSSSFNPTAEELNALQQRLERASRGISDLAFRENTHLKILLTGFDPFLLDRNISQSNPSGVTALLFDGLIIEYQGITAEINTLMVPVRYGDFDRGFVENALAPFYINESVNLITTVSMGRSEFDLERFPGKRRSASAPGNLNQYSGGSKENPVLMTLAGETISGPEFVEFSLPVDAMKQAKGKYKINDNHQVTTLTKKFKPKTLAELENEIAVEGGGGGYLSNEISYRSIRLRNLMGSNIPTGHIHTPRIQSHDPKVIKAIVDQIEEMLKLSLPVLNDKKNTQ
ncbi:hypothetical protein FLL45_03940 [Aliikangiella marina]|uniref:Pyrrolidone-carboxylate peptidase n=2 Tax=Aliikangiella marina TaxID=1712262 RepID=A0A545TK44_9GAMM|nr:hypothetical protein FLL45_03940 [Aliikangiella marina]